MMRDNAMADRESDAGTAMKGQELLRWRTLLSRYHFLTPKSFGAKNPSTHASDSEVLARRDAPYEAQGVYIAFDDLPHTDPDASSGSGVSAGPGKDE